MNFFQKSHVRADYAEFLQLAVIFLGGEPEKKIKFKTPGAVSRARWMNKAIYALKIWMFRSQFEMSDRDEIMMKNVGLFCVVIYIKFWFLSPIANQAPRNDLMFLQAMKR